MENGRVKELLEKAWGLISPRKRLALIVQAWEEIPRGFFSYIPFTWAFYRRRYFERLCENVLYDGYLLAVRMCYERALGAHQSKRDEDFCHWVSVALSWLGNVPDGFTGADLVRGALGGIVNDTD